MRDGPDFARGILLCLKVLAFGLAFLIVLELAIANSSTVQNVQATDNQ